MRLTLAKKRNEREASSIANLPRARVISSIFIHTSDGIITPARIIRPGRHYVVNRSAHFILGVDLEPDRDLELQSRGILEEQIGVDVDHRPRKTSELRSVHKRRRRTEDPSRDVHLI